MIDLLDLMPLQPSRVFYRLLEFWLFFAACDDIEPVTIPPILGNVSFIGGKQDRPGVSRNPFDFDEPQFSGV